MPSAGFELGVDLGTSNTVAVLRWPDARTKPLLFDGSPLLPSAVYAEPGAIGPRQGLLTGRDAVHTARVDPARFEPNPKRRIDEGSVLLGDREIPVVDLLSAVLGRVWHETTRITGGLAPTVTTLTCPAAWAAPRRAVLETAARQAGLPPVRLVEEPVAAATYFASVLGRQVPIGSVVVVHDFGAGTFDASVVARHATGYEVLAVDGRGDLGGLDIDALIVAHFAAAYRGLDEAAWQRLTDPTTLEDRRHRRLLWEDACAIKEQLSRSQAADLVIPLVNVDAHLTRAELEVLARPLLDRTVKVTEGAMRWAKLAEGRVAGLFLVGGSSRIPLLATLLHRTFGFPPDVLEQPELVVAEGALFAAATPPTSPNATVSWRPPAPPGGVLPTSGGPGYPVSGAAPYGAPVSVPPASAQPVSSQPVSSQPVSAGSVGVGPAGVGSVGAGSVGVGTGAAPSAAPVSGTPASPAPAFQAGRAVVPDARPVPGRSPRPPSVVNPTRALPRVTAPPATYPPPSQAPASQAPASYSAPGYQAYPAVQYAQPRPAAPVVQEWQPQPQGSSGGPGRMLRAMLITLLLLATPVVAAYVSYQLTTGQALWPITFNY